MKCQHNYKTFIATDIDQSSDLRDSLMEYEANLDLNGDEFGLQHFSYNNSGVLDLVFGNLNRTQLSGITVSSYGDLLICVIHFSYAMRYDCYYVYYMNP